MDRAADQATQVDAELEMLRRENAQYAQALAKQEQFFERIVEATRVKVRVPKFTVPKQNAQTAGS